MVFGCNRDFRQKLAAKFPADESLQQTSTDKFIINQFIKENK